MRLWKPHRWEINFHLWQILNSHASQLFSKVFLQVITLQGVCGETRPWANTANHPARPARQSGSPAWLMSPQGNWISEGRTNHTLKQNTWLVEYITGNLLTDPTCMQLWGKEEGKGLELCWWLTHPGHKHLRPRGPDYQHQILGSKLWSSRDTGPLCDLRQALGFSRQPWSPPKPIPRSSPLLAKPQFASSGPSLARSGHSDMACHPVLTHNE